MKLLISISLCLLMTTQAIAECDNAVFLKKGDIVKDCDRVGLSVEYNQKVMEDIVEGQYASKIIEEQDKIISLKDLSISLNEKQSDLWKSEALREREALDAEKGKGNKSLWIGIAMGILLTIGAGYAVGQVAKSSR